MGRLQKKDEDWGIADKTRAWISHKSKWEVHCFILTLGGRSWLFFKDTQLPLFLWNLSPKADNYWLSPFSFCVTFGFSRCFFNIHWTKSTIHLLICWIYYFILTSLFNFYFPFIRLKWSPLNVHILQTVKNIQTNAGLCYSLIKCLKNSGTGRRYRL